MVTLQEILERLEIGRWEGRHGRYLHFGHCDPFPQQHIREPEQTYEEYLFSWVRLYARTYSITSIDIRGGGMEQEWKARIHREYSLWLPRSVDEPDLPLTQDTADLWHWGNRCEYQNPTPPIPRVLRQFLR